MQANVRIEDNSKAWGKQRDESHDRALNRMAVDIERSAKMVAPHDTGRLASTGLHKKESKLKYSVGFSTVYARFQEFGGDSKRRVRNYSKPGKKAHYLKDSGDLVAGKVVDYFKREV